MTKKGASRTSTMTKVEDVGSPQQQEEEEHRSAAEQTQENGKKDKVFFIPYNEETESHNVRRRAILEKYPYIGKMYGPDPFVAWDIVARVCLFTAVALLMQELETWQVLVLSLVLGGTISHSMSLAAHELSHGLCFENPFWSRMILLFSNLPVGAPSGFSFSKYHSRHHDFLGVFNVDVDIPSLWEGFFFRSKLRKLVWLFLQPGFYAFRPFILDPLPLTKWEAINIVTAVSYDYLLYHFGGYKALLFMFLGTYLGMTVHPLAGHFISEHYNFDPVHETYSYYGPANLIAYSVGYHVEHHDFRRISYRKLHLLKQLAPEFYNYLPAHYSWSKVLWDFVFRDDVGTRSRVVRTETYQQELANALKSASSNGRLWCDRVARAMSDSD